MTDEAPDKKAGWRGWRKNLSWKRVTGLVLVGLLAWGIGPSLYYRYIPPSKELDPTKPGFDPMQFRFEDYVNHWRFFRGPETRWEEDLGYAINHMFPPGTSMEYVDKILVEQAGVQKLYPISIEGVAFYPSDALPADFKSGNHPGVAIIFNANQKVISIRSPIFGEAR